MAELYPIEDVLEKLAGFSGIQRVFLSTSGTLQTALSAYFGTPVKVRVIEQRGVGSDTTTFYRKVEMFLATRPDIVVCVAESVVHCLTPEYMQAIEKGELGLGQIIAFYGLRPTFELKSVEMCPDQHNFARTYWLRTGELDYLITETFPLELYP